MKKFVITIDVEVDAIYPTWKTSSPLSFCGVTDGVPILEKIASSENVQFTYLLSPLVLFNESCVSIFKSLRTEIGTHLHGDYVAPRARYTGLDFSGCDPIDKQKDYSRLIEYEKLSNLTDLFIKKIGTQPKSFRAGRFGLGKNTLSILRELKYTHDTSVVPGWKQFKNQTSCKTYMKNGITEVPVTVDYRRKWLRPSKGYSTKKDIKKIVSWLCRKRIPIACCMFHNTEIIPKISPYCNSKKDQNKIIDRLKLIINLLRDKKYKALCLKDI